MGKFLDDEVKIELQSSRGKKYRSNRPITANTAFGNVVKVIYDQHKRSIGAINVNVKTENQDVLNVTMGPLSPHMYTVPLPNEKVSCIRDPRRGNTWYYTGIASDGPQINIIPIADSVTWTADESQPYFGETFKPYPNSSRAIDTLEGDVVIQGRFGSSLRMSGTNNAAKVPWRYSKNKAQTPITILRTGWVPIEDMLYDASSLWLTTDQHVPVPLKSDLPSDLQSTKDKFDHSQCILYSDRIVLGTRLEHIILNSAENIHLCTSKWRHDVDIVLDLMEELITTITDITKELINTNFYCQWQTMIIPAIGQTALSTRTADFANVQGNTLNLQTQLSNLGTKLEQLKQK